MSETLLTKCPHCGTTFRLTQAQLQIASGAVRCGACYQVFHANEHIVKTAIVEEIRQAPAPKSDPVDEAFKLKDDDHLDPYDSPDFDLDSTDTKLFNEDYRAKMDADLSLDEFGYTETTTTKKSKDADESWAEDLLKELGDDFADDGDDGLIHDDMDSKKKQSRIASADSAFSLDDDDSFSPRPPRKRKSGDDLSDTFRTLGTFSSDDPFAIHDLDEDDEVIGPADSHDESWAKALLDELEEEKAPPKTPEKLALAEEVKPAPADNPFAARELARNRREAVERAKAEDKLKPKPVRKPAEPKSATAGTEHSLRNAETEEFFRLLEDPHANTGNARAAPEPSLQLSDLDELDDIKELETGADDGPEKPEKLFRDADDLVNQQIKISRLKYTDDEPEPRTGRQFLLALGILILLLTGLGQYVYFNFDSLARHPQWRPLLEQVCQRVGCQLPVQVDVNAIVGTNLVVRSHPRVANALMVDLIIKNKAPFEQPFPAMELDFDDINGNPVASRVFQPVEYIHDKTIDLQRMPPDVPIHLSLEIVDPGKNAVNYQVHFLAAGAAVP